MPRPVKSSITYSKVRGGATITAKGAAAQALFDALCGKKTSAPKPVAEQPDPRGGHDPAGKAPGEP